MTRIYLSAIVFFLLYGDTLFSQSISINTSGAANSTLSMLEVLQISTTANANGVHLAHSGAIAGAGYGLWSEVTGASTTNIAGYFTASGATNNYPGIFMGGNVGIGIATPARRLDIQQSADAVSNGIGIINTAGAARLNLWMNGTSGEIDAGGTGQNFLLLNAGGGGGNVGIGTTAPGAKLDIAGATNGSGMNLRTVGDIMVGTGTGSTIFFDGNYNYASGNYIQATAANTQTYWTSGSERMRITSAGNVGIGTSAPGYPLEIASGAAQLANALSILPSTHATSRRASIKLDDWLFVQDINANGPKDFEIWQVSTALPRLNITTTGNVGIGITAPTAHLEVYDATSGANSLTVSKYFNGIGNTTAAFIGGTDFAYGNTGIYVAQKDGLGLNSATSYIFNVVNNAVSQMLVTGLGDVGIGVAAPAAKLDVLGDIKFRNGSGSLFWSNVAARDFDILQSATSTNRAFTVHSGNTSGSAFGNVAIDFYGNDGAGNNLPGFTMLRNTNVGIGTTAPCAKLDVNGNTSITGNLYVTGTVYAGGWGGAAACPSDIRYKKNISPLVNSLNGILELQGVNYFLRASEFPDRFFSEERQVGFIAQDIEKIFPDLVKTDKDGFKAVDYTRLTPILVEAIKEQQKMIEKLRSDNEALKTNSDGRIEKLEAEVKLLMQMVKEETRK